MQAFATVHSMRGNRFLLQGLVEIFLAEAGLKNLPVTIVRDDSTPVLDCSGDPTVPLDAEICLSVGSNSEYDRVSAIVKDGLAKLHYAPVITNYMAILAQQRAA